MCLSVIWFCKESRLPKGLLQSFCGHLSWIVFVLGGVEQVDQIGDPQFGLLVFMLSSSSFGEVSDSLSAVFSSSSSSSGEALDSLATVFSSSSFSPGEASNSLAAVFPLSSSSCEASDLLRRGVLVPVGPLPSYFSLCSGV